MKPLSERRFDLSLSDRFAAGLGTYAVLYRELLERVGEAETHALWDVLPEEPDELAREILTLTPERGIGTTDPRSIERHVRDIFSSAVRGIDADTAARFLRSRPPFLFIERTWPALAGTLCLTTYEALHLFRDALARITEEAIRVFGHSGQLMVYDALSPDPEDFTPLSADEFMEARREDYVSPPQEETIFSAGLDTRLIRADQDEILAHVTRCEWARYFGERHPTVGYLLACSFDAAIYRFQCPDIRLQRRCTLIEGAEYCEFLFHRVHPAL